MNRLLYSASQSFEQAEEFLNYRVDTVINVSALLQVNQNIQTVLGKKRESVEGDIYAQNTDMISLENEIYSMYNSVDIYQISLYVPGYLMYANQQVWFRNLDEFKQTGEYRRLKESDGNGIWLAPADLYSSDTNKSVEVISYLQNIRDVSHLEESIAVQRVSIKSSDITSLMKKSNITTAGLVWIVNGRGEMISCSEPDLYHKMEREICGLKDKIVQMEEWEKLKIADERFHVRMAQIGQTDWTLAASAFAVWYSDTITSRISRLAAQMESVGSGMPHFKEEIFAGDEIGQLSRSFLDMSRRLEELMNQEYENGKLVKHAELKALQAQINPHFLYNTLDLINWEAIECGASRIAKISRALAKFYKLSLNKGKEFSRLKEELEHVESYIMIQNFRYNDRLQLIRDVPEELMECEVLHIILQPLVENSFVHGMAGKAEDDILRLCIRAREEGDDLILEVADNGNGMTDEQIKTILDADTKSGYGVRNIHTRIRLVYGDVYGLTYLRNEWGGVTVRIRFPKERGELS